MTLCPKKKLFRAGLFWAFLCFFELDMACNEGAQLELLARDIAGKNYVGYAFWAVCYTPTTCPRQWLMGEL
jgi:hypothetical protein